MINLNDCNISDEEMRSIYKKIGLNVKRIREEKRISQLHLALSIGHKAVGVISHSEICIQNKHFNVEHLVKISAVLDVDIKEFFVDLNL